MTVGNVGAYLYLPDISYWIVRNTSDYAYSMSNTPAIPVDFNAVQASSALLTYSTSSNLFTVNAPGVYLITAQIQVDPTSGSFVPCNIYMTINGSTAAIGQGTNFNVGYVESPYLMYSFQLTNISYLPQGALVAFYLVGNFSLSGSPPQNITVRGYPPGTYAMLTYLRNQ